MVAHLMAAGVMAATALGVAQDCDAGDDKNGEGDDNHFLNLNRLRSENEIDNEDDDGEGDDARDGRNPKIRSVAQRSERFPKDSMSFTYRRPDGGILLEPQSNGGKVGGTASDDVATSNDGESLCDAPLPLPYGFLRGNFGAGKICEVKVPGQSSCYAVSFHPTGKFIAVGLREGVAIYETCSYSLVHMLELDDMVSAISWIAPDPSDANHSCLLLVGTLDGLVALYCVDVHILESQGPSVLYHHRVTGQVRALSACLVSTGNDEASTVLIAVGTKAGIVTLVCVPVAEVGRATRAIDPNLASTRVVAREATAVLGIDLHATNFRNS